MALTKDRIIDSIYKNTDLMKFEAAQTFQSLLEIMKQSLESGEDILISGFGKFSVREKNARRGRNPQTGESLVKCTGTLFNNLILKRLLRGFLHYSIWKRIT